MKSRLFLAVSFLYITGLLLLPNRGKCGNMNYITYHKEILTAENDFLRENFRQSIEKYKEVFSKYPKHFAKDCYIALQIACYINDTSSATFFFKKTFYKGVNWKTLQSSTHVQNIFAQNPKYIFHVRRIYSVYRTKYLAGINKSLRKAIIQMRVRDDKYKLMSFDRLPEHEQAYIRVLDSNTAALVAHIKKYGFPGKMKLVYGIVK